MGRIAVNTVYMALLLTALASSAAMAQVSFTVSADRATAAAGERAVVIATLVTPKAVSVAPSAGSSDAFEVLNVNTGSSQSHSVQMLNGRVERKSEITYRYIYTIISKTDGAFTFPALTVSVDGNSYGTRPLHFNGGSGGSGSGGGGSGGNASGGAPAPVRPSPDIRVTLNLSKKSLYVGEQAVLTLKVAQRAGTPIQTQRGYSGAVEQIEKAFAAGFSLNRMFANQVTQGQERIGADAYNTFILKFAVFGLAAGEYQIGALDFDYDEIVQSRSRPANPFFQDFFEMDFFGGRQAVQRRTRAEPFSVTVKPRPGGAHAGYGGSVGKFSVSASVEPQAVTAGEAVTLRITLKGDTRASNMGDPVLPEIKNCDVFPPERQTAVDTGANGFSTKKTYRYLIIPQREGEMAIEPIAYPYLDPESGVYKTARSDTLRISVAKGLAVAREQTRYLTQEEIRQVGNDIRYIKTPRKLANMDERPYRAPLWYLLFPMPFLIFISALVYKEQAKRSGENRFKAIRQRALGNAVRELNRAGKGGTDGEFLGKASNVIEKYISSKFAFPATGRTLEELKDELLSRRIEEQAVAGLAALIEGIDEYRFGGKAFDSRSRGEIIKQIASFLGGMEKSAQRAKGVAARAALVAAALLAPMAVPADAAAGPASDAADRGAWFQKANELYAANAYDSALVYYEKVLGAGVKNDALYYNMGNCQYRLMKPGLARLYYEKAAALAPGDPDIKANIGIVASIIVDRQAADDKAESDFLTSVLYGIHTLLPLNAQLMAVCGLLFLLSLLASAMLLRRGLTRLWLAYGAVLCALLIIVVGVSAGYKIYALESKRYAVILSPSADAKNQPGGDQTLFTAHEGTKLRVRKAVGEWNLVSLPNGASGWMPAEALGKI
jgi:tetratricopeptide (TPR) repeat protein